MTSFQNIEIFKQPIYTDNLLTLLILPINSLQYINILFYLQMIDSRIGPQNQLIISANFEIKCKGLKPITKICCSTECLRQSLHCEDGQCTYCRNVHDFCYRFQYPRLAEIIKQKIYTNKAFIDQFLQYEKQIMVKMAQMRSGINDLVQFGWIEKKYADILREIYINRNSTILRGRQAYSLCQVLKKSHQVIQKDAKVKIIVQQFTVATNKMIEDYQKLKFDAMVSIINVEGKPSSNINPVTPLNSAPTPSVINSKILTTPDASLIKTWLKNPKKIQLIFRGSEFGFQSSKFHQLCDNTPHTLILVKNQFQKVFGGYTPLKWNSAVNNYVVDPSGETFIFSLNLKQKMNLMTNQYAIYCNPTFGPTFGAGNDICIAHHCHTNGGSFCNFPASFNHLTPYSNGQSSFTAFCGAVSGYNFKVLQYEVFKISWT